MTDLMTLPISLQYDLLQSFHWWLENYEICKYLEELFKVT